MKGKLSCHECRTPSLSVRLAKGKEPHVLHYRVTMTLNHTAVFLGVLMWPTERELDT